MKELTGHYVNYRKQASPDMRDLLPEADIRLYAVCACRPAGLGTLAEVGEGVYDYQRGTDRFRVIVTGRLPQEEHNAMLQLFAAAEPVRFAAEHYRQRSEDSSTLIQELVKRYLEEGLPMPYTMEDYRREVRERILREMNPEEILAEMSIEDRLKGLSPEDLRKVLPVEERLKGLTVEQIEAYLRKAKGEAPDDE